MRVTLWPALLVLLALGAAPSSAGLFDRLATLGAGGSARVAKSATLAEQAAAHVARLPAKLESGATALAAHVTQEGHWRLTNRAGETFLAANAEELRRGLAILAPDLAASPAGRPALFFDEASLFRLREKLPEAPKVAEFHAVTRQGVFPLRFSAAGEPLVAIRPGVLVSARDEALFGEALYQLVRPLNRANIRVLAVEPGGPATLPVAPRIYPATRKPMIDAIDPARLGEALAKIRGQTAMLVGRIDGDALRFKPARGAEIGLPTAELMAAAARADVDLVILRSASAAQPGGRNWLWLKTEVKGLDEAMRRATTADFLATLRRPSSELVVSTDAHGALTTLEVVARPAAAATTSTRVGDALGEIAFELIGKLTIDGARIVALNQERREEIDRRIVSWIPSAVTHVYIGAVVMGLIGWRVSRQWWSRLWPAEAHSEYRNRAGFAAARAAREIIYLLLFLPLAGLPALVLAAAIGVAESARTLVSLLKRWFGGNVQAQ